MEIYTLFMGRKLVLLKYLPILPKAIYTFKTNSIKIPKYQFHRTGIIILKFVWRYRSFPNDQSNLEKEQN